MLLTVYDPAGGWHLELNMADKRMGHLDDGLAALEEGERLLVSYVLNTEPNVTRYGAIAEVHPATELHEEEGHTVRLRVAIDVARGEQPIVDPRPGATVIGQVHCGRRSLGYVWFHEVGEALQRFWFSLF